MPRCGPRERKKRYQIGILSARLFSTAAPGQEWKAQPRSQQAIGLATLVSLKGRSRGLNTDTLKHLPLSLAPKSYSSASASMLITAGFQHLDRAVAVC